MTKLGEIDKDKILSLRESELINKSDYKLNSTLGNFISKYICKK